MTDSPDKKESSDPSVFVYRMRNGEFVFPIEQPLMLIHDTEDDADINSSP